MEADSKHRFDHFITRHLEDARRFAGIYVKNPQDAEDVVSESIERALRRIHTLREPDSMKTWFYRIIINTSMSHMKKQSQTLPLGQEAHILYSDDFSRLEFDGLLSMLPDGDRKIVHLRFYDNQELKDIARILSMNENTVKTRLYRALKKLKLEITKDGAGVSPARSKTKSTVKNAAALGFAFLLTATLLLNLFPSLAMAAYDIPVVSDIVRAITFHRFDYKHKNLEAEIVVPGISGLLDQELQDKLNNEFQEFAGEFIRSFEATILEMEAQGLDDDTAEPPHMSVKADYSVKTNNLRILSIDAYLYSDTNALVVHRFCTIDKHSGTLVTLPGLFLPGADYITPISAYIAGEMLRQNQEEDGMFSINNPYFDDFTAIKPEQNFYIHDDGRLVICFDKYEVAAGPQGSPEFVIPASVICDILAVDYSG